MCSVWEAWSRYAKRKYAKGVLRAVEARWNLEHEITAESDK